MRTRLYSKNNSNSNSSGPSPAPLTVVELTGKDGYIQTFFQCFILLILHLSLI